MELLNCSDIKVSYDNRTVIKDLSFTVNYGDYLCIVGDNGAGKSTLIKCILGLKQLSGGTITFDSGISRSQIGYLSQSSSVTDDFPASVFEVVMSGCLNRHKLSPVYSKQEKENAMSILDKLGMTDLASSEYKSLSGGQKKRVMLARALMASEKLLILDEPVAALDPIATEEFYETMSALHKEGLTLIMVSHDIHTAVHQATHILHLSNQIPNFFGTRSEYLNSSAGHSYMGDRGICSQCNKGLSPAIKIHI